MTLLFNTYICDLFFENSDADIANHVGDNTPYACSSDLDSVIFKFQKNPERSFRWFHSKNLISNAEKSHLIVISKKSLEVSFRWAHLVQNIQGLSYQNAEGLSFMTLRSDAKFE